VQPKTVTKTNNIIELNGKRYDAVTGVFVGAVDASVNVTTPKAPEHTAKSNKPRRGVVVDGIIKPGTHSKTNMASIPVRPAPDIQAPKKSVAHPLKPIAAHKPEHSKTLMRHAVKAPKIDAKKHMKAYAPTDLIKKQPSVLTVKPKLSSELVDAKRADRAKHVPRSQAVDRFYRQPRAANYSVAATASGTARPSSNLRTMDGMRRPSQYVQRKPSMFEQAVAAADSHEQAVPKEVRRHKTKRQARKHGKILKFAAATCAVVLLAGFIAYQNKANIELQLASAKAGFPASMPGYKPSGYAVNGLTYSPGTVTIGFHSNSQNFNVVQKTSNWDSQTLLENFVATTGQPYNTYQAAGRTIYVYNNGNATWVNGGVWYQVNGNAHLGSDQIINLATSM
jgi:hypothetical protein